MLDPQPLSDIIPPTLQNLEKEDSKKYQSSKNLDRPEKRKEYYVHPNDAKQIIFTTGLGIIYTDFDDTKIRLKEQLEEKVTKPFLAGERKGLVISGTKGTGKTTDLHWLAYQFLTRIPANVTGYTERDGNFKPLNVNPPIQIRMIRTSRLVTMLIEKRYEEIETLENIQILMLDDFARHFKHDYPTAKLEEFIETRYANLRPTFITLDITLQELAEEPDWAAMTDRFRDKKWMFPALVIPGESQR